VSRFSDWSSNIGLTPYNFASDRPQPLAQMSIMSGSAQIIHGPIDIDVGEACADITGNHARIRHPKPFEDNGSLSDAFRIFLVEQMRAAVDRDRRLRWIGWADAQPTSCNPINGRRRPFKLRRF